MAESANTQYFSNYTIQSLNSNSTYYTVVIIVLITQ